MQGSGLVPSCHDAPKTELATEGWLRHFRDLRQHRGQHSPSGTVALEQGMMGQDTFLQMVTEFCKAREGEEKMLPGLLQRGAFCDISIISQDTGRVVFMGGMSLLDL